MKPLENKTFLWTLIGILVIMNLVSIGALWKSHLGHERSSERIERHLERSLFRKMGLSQDQKKTIREIHRENQRAIRKTQTEIERLKRDLALHSEDAFKDPGKLDSIMNELGQKHAELERVHLEMVQKLREISSKEQQEKLDAMLRRLERHHRRETKRHHSEKDPAR